MVCSYLNFYKYFHHFELLGQQYYKYESIHLNSWHHNHKKQKDSLETQVVFSLNLKYYGWSYRECIKKVKNGSFCEELLSENDFEAVLSIFCCYDCGANALEAVQKISTRALSCMAAH